MTMPRAHFHPFLRILHWLMAALILSMLMIGIGMVSTAGPAYSTLVALHRPIGITILALVIVRLVIRLTTGAPPLPGDLPAWQVRLAKASHLLLYATMIVLPLVGWAMLSAAGYPVQLAPGVVLPPILPHDLDIYAVLRVAHTVIALLFFALILGHLAAGLTHALIRRDGVFAAIGWGGKAHHAAPPAD